MAVMIPIYPAIKAKTKAVGQALMVWFAVVMALVMLRVMLAQDNGKEALKWLFVVGLLYLATTSSSRRLSHGN